jgi:DNA repair exonuclease SbcCD nuclease subunit
MKIAIVGDVHMGARSGSPVFAEYFNKFFSDVFYPYLLDHGIDQMYFLGDVFDNRTLLPMRAYNMSKPVWFQPLVDNGMTMHMLLGNHDIAMRDSLTINSPELVLDKYISTGHVKIYKEPTAVVVDSNTTFDIIPWICKENADEVSEFMNRKKVSDLCLGHFEIVGASMYNGVPPSQTGLSPDIFDRYERTLSGHYHTRSTVGDSKIQYVGTPYEITWMDAHDPRGFHVFDTVTRELEFIPNPYTMFQKVFYRGNDTVVPKDIGGKFIKLVVESKTDAKKFDAFLSSMWLIKPNDISIIENLEEWNGGVITEEDIDIDDTISVMRKYIDSLEIEVDKEKVKDYLNGLYMEAITK